MGDIEIAWTCLEPSFGVKSLKNVLEKKSQLALLSFVPEGKDHWTCLWKKVE